MQRRSFLRSTAIVSGIAVAGCVGRGDDGGSENTVLGEPEREYDVDPEALAYPAYGQTIPAFDLPSPLHDRTVSTREYVGERETLLTFVFTRCGGPCPAQTAALARTQTAADDGSYSDEVVFMPITFDPEYDTETRIREFSEINGADPTAENWQFLRPETPERATEVVQSDDGFAVAFEEAEGDGGHGNGTDQGEVLEPDEEGEEISFIHSNLLLLVNRDGYVERAYSPQPPRPDIVIEDLEAVREGYA